MDKEIFKKYKNELKPFDGKTIHIHTDKHRPDSIIKLPQLRGVVKSIFEFLLTNDLLTNIYMCKDWIEHDLYLPNKYSISKEFLKEYLENDNVFFDNGVLDTHVNLGFYDENSSWYLRVYIDTDEQKNDLKNYYGRFDITLNCVQAISLKNLLEQNLQIKLDISNPSTYFEKIICANPRYEEQFLEK